MSDNKSKFQIVIDEASKMEFNPEEFQEWLSNSTTFADSVYVSAPSNYPASGWSNPAQKDEIRHVTQKWENLTEKVEAFFRCIDHHLGGTQVQETWKYIEKELRFAAGIGYSESKLFDYLYEVRAEVNLLRTKLQREVKRAEKAEELAVQMKIERDGLREELENIE